MEKDPEKKEKVEEEVKDNKEKKKKKGKKLDSKTKKIILIIVGVLLLLGAVSALYFFVFNKEEVLKTYTIKELDTTYTFENTGIIATDEIAEYNLEESDTVEFLVNDYNAVGDEITINETLFNYKETSYGDNLYVGPKPDTGGEVIIANPDAVAVRTSISASDTLTAYTPVVGDCAILVYDVGGVEYTVNAEVASIHLPIIPGIIAIFDLVNPDINIVNGETAVSHYQNTLRSEMYGCEVIEWINNKIVVPNVGQADPEHSDVAVTFTAGIDEYEDILATEDTPSADDYEFVSKDGLNVSPGELVTTSSILYKYTYKEINEDAKTLKSFINGIVKYVKLNVDDGTFDIEIYDTDENYLTFIIAEDYLDKISLDSIASVINEDEAVDLTLPIVSIEEGKAVIDNTSFKTYPLDTEFDIKVEGDGETVLLIPKTYVKDSKVKIIVDDVVEETTITYEEYNEDNYKILTGLLVDDIVEEYE